MPTRATSTPAAPAHIDIATTRILRLAFGTAASLWISQAVGWSISFIAPVITMFLLAMPLSRPQPKFFLLVVVALTVTIYGSFVFLPLLLHQEIVGLLLLSLALFHAFYFTARGGSPVVGLERRQGALEVGMTNQWLKDQGVLSVKELWVNIHYPATAR